VIYYLIADYLAHSWGNGIIYEHVRVLREAGFEACALHHALWFRPTWLDFDIPIRYVEEPGFAPTKDDVVVVPEVLAASDVVQQHPWRKIIFVQGTFLIFRGLQQHRDYAELGFERAMAILPHAAHVIERHFGVRADVVPPYIAPYFFDEPEAPREKRVLFAWKEGYRALGIPDQEIALRLMEKEIERRPEWSMVRLEGFTHTEVAALMRTSMFLVNVFSHEAFNTTVPEAMAAGCVPICYDGGGLRDILRDEENAIVFPNQYVYELVERVCDMLDHPDEELLTRLRKNGRETAATFNRERTAAAVIDFFLSVIPSREDGEESPE
jgi:hypothetical protein